jgi:pSer/pThr/pTyr-binding forkhead associated (FHA) protein
MKNMTQCIILFIFIRNFQPSKSTIKIGRSADNEITIEDNMLSRIHCTIEYRDHVGWIIRDGSNLRTNDGKYDAKQSTNGTWIYAMDDTMIYDGMIFKANHNLFEVI